jgi:hypothetical protein
MMDLDDLSDRLQTSLRYVRLYQAEREFLAELIQAYIRQRGRKEIASQKAIAVAQRVIWLEEFRGLKTEAAIADAEQRFGLKRTRVTDILKEQRPKLDSFRSHVSSDAYRQAYALISALAPAPSLERGYLFRANIPPIFLSTAAERRSCTSQLTSRHRGGSATRAAGALDLNKGRIGDAPVSPVPAAALMVAAVCWPLPAVGTFSK